MATKKEMEFCFKLIKQNCQIALEAKVNESDSSLAREWEAIYNQGMKIVAEQILKKINNLEKGEYKFVN